MPGNSDAMDRLRRTLAAIDRLNAGDPVVEPDPATGGDRPRALLYGERMSDRLAAYEPDAGELLRIAVRAQHIRRWEIPRDSFPTGRQGYHRWRRRLAEYHAELTGELMAAEGYDEKSIRTVGRLLRKEGLKRDPQVQTLEDVAAQVFLLHYLERFVAEHGHEHDEDKLLGIIRKTWNKMSERGRRESLELPIPGAVRPTVLVAVGEV